MKKCDLSKVYFLYFLILVGLVVFRLLSSAGVLSFFGESGDYVFTFVIQILLLFCLSVFGFGKLAKKSNNIVLKEYKFKKISKKTIIIAIFMGIIVYFLNSFIASFFYFLLSCFGFRLSSSGAISTYPVWLLFVNIIFTALLPAVCEETAHRGMLLSQISKKSVTKAIILSSLLFGLLHINIYQFFYATILGVFLAKLTVDSGSIYPAMIIHFMNNAINVYMSFANANGLFSAKIVNLFFAIMSGNGVLSILFFVLFVVFLLASLRFLYDLMKEDVMAERVRKLRSGLGKLVAREVFFEEVKSINGSQILPTKKEINLTIINDFFAKNDQKNTEKASNKANFYEKLFLFVCVGMSLVSTIFTFIWGII